MEQELQPKAGALSPSIIKDLIVNHGDQPTSLIDVSVTDSSFQTQLSVTLKVNL